MGSYPFYNLLTISRIVQDSHKGSFYTFSHMIDLGLKICFSSLKIVVFLIGYLFSVFSQGQALMNTGVI